MNRILSMLTASIMAFSLLGVVPAMTAGAESVGNSVSYSRSNTTSAITKTGTSAKTATILVSKTVKLKVSGTKKKVVWKSSNKKIATVSSKGKVKGKKPGKVAIKAKAGKKFYTWKVKVKIGLDKTNVSLKVGNNKKLKLCGAKIKSAKSSNKKVATVTKKGKIKAKKVGKCKIIVTGSNKKKYICKVKVKKTAVNTSIPTKPTATTPVPNKPVPTTPDAGGTENGTDNLNDDVIDKGDIQALQSAGKINVIYGDNGEIISIDGAFTDEKVTSVSKAADVLNSASALMGEDFYANSSDIVKQEINDGSNTIVYRYSPYYDYPVLGSQVILTTNSAGNVNGLHNTYDNRINGVETYIDIDEEEAKEAAVEKLLKKGDLQQYLESQSKTADDLEDVIKIKDPELMIYAADNSDRPSLVYAVNVTSYGNLDGQTQEDAGSNGMSQLSTTVELESVDDSQEGKSEEIPIIDTTYYIYANDDVASAGEIYKEIDNTLSWDSVTLQAKDLKDNKKTFIGQQEGTQYRLKDATRNLTTYKTTHNGFLWWRESVLPGSIAKSFLNLLQKPTIEKTAVSAHTNMETVYDFYLNVLNRKSFDGNGASVKVSYDYGNQYRNAFWSSDYQQMVFGDLGNYAAALDVAGHEFTHAVINYVVGDGANTTLTYEGESGALNESYADIMGCLIENKSGEDRWELGEDSDSAIRSLAKPSKYQQPEDYSNQYTGDDDNGGVHTNSGIFNFAAYKMMTDARTSNKDNNMWAKVFYNSLYRLSTSATFLDARAAVICAAKVLGFNHDEQQAIKDAFDAVGIKEPESVRIVLTWGSTPQDLDSHLVGPGVFNSDDRFHIYYDDRTYYNDGEYYSSNSLYAADLDYDDTTSYGPEITTIHTLTPGDYYFFVHDYTNLDNIYSTELSQSGATVKIYIGSNSQPEATYRIQGTEEAIYWNVCKITIDSNKNISITPINGLSTSQTYY